MLKAPLAAEAFKRRIDGRPLYIWGAGQSGAGLVKALSRINVRPDGFIDNRKQLHNGTVMGIPVSSPDATFSRQDNPHVIIATFQYQTEIAALCEQRGLRPERDYTCYDELNPLNYQIVVAGVCNLRCISCPVGNQRDEKRPIGYMDADTYEQVLHKVLDENPMVGVVQLYNWGEPLLNKQLPEIIRRGNALGIMAALSSNLSVKVDFEDVIRAQPGVFRISVSGCDDDYAITHTGGRWDLVLANMHKLSAWRDQYAPEMIVEVTYHLYRHNTGEHYQRVEDICSDLGFVFRSHQAALLPLDNVYNYKHGLPISKEAEQTIDMLLLPIDDALEAAQRGGDVDPYCTFEHTINIDYNLQVIHCGLYFGLTDNKVGDNYLDLPLDEILAVRNDSSLCARCKEDGLHHFCRQYTSEKVIEPIQIASVG
jgi:MoaA/NifB/PqqE/SkfB family radical SAM enzyme